MPGCFTRSIKRTWTFLNRRPETHQKFNRKETKQTMMFWETDSRTQTPTLANMSKPMKTNERDKMMVDLEVHYLQLLAVLKNRDVNLQQVSN